MSTSTTRKRGDTAPALVITCLDDNVAVDLTTATSMRLVGTRDGGTTIAIDAAVTGNAQGVVTYDLDAADTETTGTLRLEVEVTWPDGRKQSFPASGYLTLRVEPDLG